MRLCMNVLINLTDIHISKKSCGSIFQNEVYVCAAHMYVHAQLRKDR